MADSLKLLAIITATDKLTPKLKEINRTLVKFRGQMQSAGSGGLQMAAGLTAAVLGPAAAFADLESASIGLENTLMRAGGGVPAIFADIQKQAIELGNQLPGTTADFMKMASSLNALGVSAETISGGALKATAFLSVIGKDRGVTYEQAAEAIGKLGNSLGIAAQDLVPFADSLQKTIHLGVKLDEMQLAMSRVGGVLKPLGKQGLAAANELIPLNALLIRSGISGEEAGTGLRRMVTELAVAGKFKGIPAMVEWLEKLGKNDPAKLLQMMEKLFGKEHASKALTIAAGGYRKINEEMKAQASLEERAAKALSSLLNMWEAATGTVTNLGAAIGAVYGPELKATSELINEASGSMTTFAQKHKGVIRSVFAVAAGLTVLKLGFLAAGAAAGIMSTAIKITPLGWFLNALAIAVPLVIANWDKIVEVFQSAILKIGAVIDDIRAKIADLLNTLENLTGKLAMDLGKSDLRWTEQRLTEKERQADLIRQANTVSGALEVNFNNAPAGMRVAPAQNSGGIRISPNVGYRSIGTAAP